MISDTVSKNMLSLVPGRTASSASWMMSSISESLFTVSLHSMRPMSYGVRPRAAPFFRSMVLMRRTRAHRGDSSHPWNLRSLMSSSASSDLMNVMVSSLKGSRAWGQYSHSIVQSSNYITTVKGRYESVRVYLIGYIFCIIDCHICRDIFGRIDIMYYRLSYVSRGALFLKTLVLYIYRSRGTIQYNQQLFTIYSSYMVIRA
jgi:hypothetical protein